MNDSADDGSTALLICCQNGRNLNAVKLLISNGANKYAVDDVS